MQDLLTPAEAYQRIADVLGASAAKREAWRTYLAQYARIHHVGEAEVRDAVRLALFDLATAQGATRASAEASEQDRWHVEQHREVV